MALITNIKARGKWTDIVSENLKNARLQNFFDKYKMLPIEYKSEGGTGESTGKPEPRARSRSQSKEKKAKESEPKERARSRPKQKSSGASSSSQPMEGGSGASSSNQPKQSAGSGEMEDDDEEITRYQQSPLLVPSKAYYSTLREELIKAHNAKKIKDSKDIKIFYDNTDAKVYRGASKEEKDIMVKNLRPLYKKYVYDPEKK